MREAPPRLSHHKLYYRISLTSSFANRKKRRREQLFPAITLFYDIISVLQTQKSLYHSERGATHKKISGAMRKPQPLPQWMVTRPLAILWVLLIANHEITTTQAYLAHPPGSSSNGPNRAPITTTTTTRALVPFSVATAVDDWVFPWVVPETAGSAREQGSPYADTLQQPSRSVRAFVDAGETRTTPSWRPRAAEFSSSSSSSLVLPTAHAKKTYQVYCDLDGVLVDFCQGIRTLFPHHHPSQSVDALHRPNMWHRVNQEPDFFARLPWMPQGRRLWQAIRPLQPDILTGVPYRVQRSSRQKYAWCQRELGVPTRHIDKAFGKTPVAADTQKDDDDDDDDVCRVITTWSNEKHAESGPRAILIDDRLELRKAWEAKGGLFIHHAGRVDSTLHELRYYGILPDNDDENDPLAP